MKGTVYRETCLFAIGGLAYNLIEIVWRGYSHWSMFFLGGACFHAIGKIGSRLWNRGILTVGLVCSVVITVMEFFSGCLLNRCMKLNVWDYSDRFGNVGGQVCLLYSALWSVISVIAVPLYGVCRRWLTKDSSR